MTELLLDRGADLNKANEFGSTPLHFADRCGCGKQNMVKLQIERGVQMDKVDQSNSTPLHHAAMRNSKEVVQILLDGGADPAKPEDMGQTPECHARFHGRLNIVKMFSKIKRLQRE